jgi:arabinofuranosyltransferase
VTRSHLLICALALCCTVLGWWTLWFLCDDAYIAFRYVHLAHRGHGLVWNPPPFLPVEGYTSFAWVALLRAVWDGLGVAPPDAANVLSLAASLGSLGVIAHLARRLPTHGGPHGIAWFAVVLLGVTTNRTWLMWTTSGLETAMWTLVLLGWIALGTRARGGERSWIALAALMPLVRPDGLLYLAVTPFLAAWRVRTRRSLRATDALALLPYAVPAGHLLWRHATYGAWLPNTYYAKVTETWWTTGVLQALLFAYDHLFWPVVLVLPVAVVRARPLPLPTTVASLGVVAVHLLVLLRGGGDHFAYRIFVHWVVLAWLAMPWCAHALGRTGRRTLGAVVVLWAAGSAIPWSHHAITSGSGRTFWTETEQVIAPSWPWPVRPIATVHDRVGRWLAYHLVGTPHHLHVAFLAVQKQRAPSRMDVPIDGDPTLAVWASPNPGYGAYHLPDIAVIDLLGLNDHVIARTPPPENRKRKLAHERRPPEGYVACFAPNVEVTAERVTITPRDPPLDADDIRRCERSWRSWAADPFSSPARPTPPRR